MPPIGDRLKAIDKLMRRFGMPMGPLELLDQIGLDVAAHVEKSLRPFFIDRFAANPIFAEMGAAGWAGVKTSRGFFEYRGAKKKPNHLLLSSPPPALRTTVKPKLTDIDERALDRMVLVMVNEAAMCLGEGIAADAPTLDLAMVFGTGWAPHRGGPLRYADDRGLRQIVHRLEELAKKYGPRFEPCAELRRRADSREPFYPPNMRVPETNGRAAAPVRATQPSH